MNQEVTMTETDTSTTAALRTALEDAKALAWDGCHKIYVILDDGALAQMTEYGYGDDDSYLVKVGKSAASRRHALQTLHRWWSWSCSMRFITTVHDSPTDPNKGYLSVIDQFGEWDYLDDDERLALEQTV